MNIVVIDKRRVRAQSLMMQPKALFGIIGLCLLLALVCGLLLGHWWGQQSTRLPTEVTGAWRTALHDYQQDLDRLKQENQREVDALTLRLAQLQAHVLRLDALGERLTQVADLDQGEFDFNRTPALGGPEGWQEQKESAAGADLSSQIDALMHQLENREQQLAVLEDLMRHRTIESDAWLAGRPIKKGWVSSYYGWRSDPFNGRRAWHQGVDLAGKDNALIYSVAAGIVVWSGERYGYGNLVEIDHGNGFVTRYAHNKSHLVKAGDVVKRGQEIAHMGSSGRSTGPHVHFEVWKHGRPVDPITYIHRAIK